MPDFKDRTTVLLNAIDQATSATIARARTQGLSKGAEEMAQQEADEAKRHIRAMSLDYQYAKPASLETLFRPEHDKELVKVRCSISKMSRPAQIEIPRNADATVTDLLGTKASDYDQGKIITLKSTLTLADEHGNTFETEFTLDRQLIELLQVSRQQYATHEVMIFVVACPTIEPSKKRDNTDDDTSVGGPLVKKYCGFVVDARPLITALQMVSATPGEQEEARRQYGKVQDLITRGAQLAIQRLEIQEGDSLPILTEAIRFEVLNAATEGKRGHSLLLGTPGTGKSAVAKAGKMYQPVFRWALPTKITEAGLIGSGSSSAQHRKPGLLPLAHTGMLSIEDANQMNAVKNQRCMSSFTTVMQEGQVADSSASCTEYHAEVAIHLDANRRSDVRRITSGRNGLDLLISDTGVPLNVLTRMTYIAEIQRDTVTQMRVSFGMIKNKQNLTEAERKALDYKIRLLRVWMAMMRTAHPTVTFSDEIRDVLHDRLAAAFNITQDRLERHAEFGDFLTRLSEQAFTLVGAHARLHDRDIADVNDVDAILPFLWRKLDFIRTILFGSQIASVDASAAAKGRRLVIDITVKRRGALALTVDEIRRWTGMTSVTKATTIEDLRALYGDPDASGCFHVTTVRDSAA